MNMIKHCFATLSRFYHHALMMLLSLLCLSPAMAGLPTLEPPQSGGGSGLMGNIKGYMQDAIILGGLIVGAVAFIVVAMAAVQTFTEVRNEKAGWGKFGAIIVVGIILLVAVIWLLIKSASILV